MISVFDKMPSWNSYRKPLWPLSLNTIRLDNKKADLARATQRGNHYGKQLPCMYLGALSGTLTISNTTQRIPLEMDPVRPPQP